MNKQNNKEAEDAKLIEKGEEALLMKGISCKNAGDYENAIKYFKLAIENSKQSTFKSSSMYQIGLCYEKLGKYEEAISYYKRYVNTFDKSYEYFDDSYYRMGILYYENDQLQKSKSCFYSLRHEDPDSSYLITEKVKNILKSN